MKTTHTAGPWEYVAKLSGSENHKGFFIRADKPKRNGKFALADVIPFDENGTVGKANARLMACAPELLAALQELIAAGDDCVTAEDGFKAMLRIGEAHEVARKVVAKATGEAA